MRIHTDLTDRQMIDVRRNSGAPIGYEHRSEHGSRTHARAFEVRLEGSGGLNNTGLYGAGNYNGATWDEWGAFLGALYALDPTARCGGTAKRPVYANAEDFHWQTGDRFRGRLAPLETRVPGRARIFLPEDTHPRHRWVYDTPNGYRGGMHCGKAGCSATRPAWGATRGAVA